MDYTDMSSHYDLIMTSGYYDYGAVVDDLVRYQNAASALEIGSGTGLILEKLSARRPDLKISGIDLTQAMLDIASHRLASRPAVTLHRQNVVHLYLKQQYDLAFSYGGVWYFVPGEDGYEMVSHIRDERENQQGFERINAHLPSGGVLLLGIQAAHRDYTRDVADGLSYSQAITPIEDGFRKDYRLLDPTGRAVMQQTTDYRVFGFEDTVEMLDKCGFDHEAGETTPMFLKFTKR